MVESSGLRWGTMLLANVLWLPLLCAQQPTGNNPAILRIQTDQVVAKVSPTLYGLMTEEINHSYDGGIYAELVRNRAFQDNPHAPDHWRILRDGNALASMRIDDSTGPSAALASSLKLTVQQADPVNPAGIVNTGYWGIPLQADTSYEGSFYAKGDGEAREPVTISLVNNNTGVVVASATIPSVSQSWKQYKVTLRTGQIETSGSNHLVLSVTHPGTIWLSLVSLFPPTYQHTPNGNRIDIMQKLAAMHPAFLRLPGGNFLEGDHITDWYDWKKTIGPLVDRPTHPSPWGYRSSDGLGLLEFLTWCEDLHMQPVLAVYAGYSMAQEHVTPGPDLAPYVESALDEIQYVSGAADTQWGAARVKDGHPAPFPLRYIEIGNEDEFDKSGSYDGRFAQFFDAVKKAYPTLQVIATAPVTTRVPDVIDDHFYRTAQDLFADTHHYDKTDRHGPKIFVGEWATLEGTPTPDFGAALSDAAWMTGMERNSDVVIMASYAPLLVNVNPGAMQWHTNLIGYDAVYSYGSPSYYAQVMFSNNLGSEVPASTLTGAGPLVFYSVTRDIAEGFMYLKVVNASSRPQEIEVELSGSGEWNKSGTVITLAGNSPEETNTLDDPNRVVPMTSTVTGLSANFHRVFPAYSIEVVRLGFH